MSNNFELFADRVGAVNDWAGKMASYLLVPLTLVVVFEVIMRYFFDAPTIWAWDVNIQFLAVLTVVGGGYTLLHNSHIGVDILVVNRPPRVRAMIEVITSVFFFLGVVVLLWKGLGVVLMAVRTLEISESYWAPPVWPLKILLIVGIFLLLLQGIAKFIRDLTTVISPEQGS